MRTREVHKRGWGERMVLTMLFVMMAFSCAQISFAQTPQLYDPDTTAPNPYTGDTAESPVIGGQMATERHAEDLIVRIVNWVVTFLGLAAFVYLIWAGYLYILAGDTEERVTKAKGIIVQVIIGTIIVLAAYAIVFTIIGGRGRLFFY